MSYLTVCPFCEEPEFDLIGLKRHIQKGDCKVFNRTDTTCVEPDCCAFGKTKSTYCGCNLAGAFA